MTKFQCLAVLALSLTPVAAIAATGDAPVVSSKQIAMSSDGAASGEGLSQKSAQACGATAIAVYSHHTEDFWCAPIR